jgi:hypothetical protein
MTLGMSVAKEYERKNTRIGHEGSISELCVLHRITHCHSSCLFMEEHVEAVRRYRKYASINIF